MTAATFAPDLPALITERTEKLLRTIDAGRTWVRKFVEAPATHVQMAAMQRRLTLTVNGAMAFVRKSEQQTADYAIWFRGILGTIEDAPELIPADTADSLAQRLGECQDMTADLIASVEGLRTAIDAPGVSKSKALRLSRGRQVDSLVARLRDLHGVLERCRWAMLDGAADADIAADRVRMFTNVDDMIASLPH